MSGFCRSMAVLSLACLACAAPLRADDVFDSIDDALTFSADHNAVRVRLSGTLDLEEYHFDQPPPAFVVANGTDLFVPRLSLFLDAQLGQYIYVFVQSRVDKGFDPQYSNLHLGLDEYAVRFTPWKESWFNLQIGQFATVIGNWTPRHLSWDNAFITAPLPYEYLVSVWDFGPAKSASILATWGEVTAKPSTTFPIKSRSLSVVWGPAYTTGASASGMIGGFDYAIEFKNAGPESRPQNWDLSRFGFDNPTTSGRLGYRPNDTLNFGFSASTGSYLAPYLPQTSLLPGYTLNDYREILFGQDAAWLYHNWSVYAEVFETRYQVPRVGNADVTAYYVEGKYKFDAHWSLAARWNQELFNQLPSGATMIDWDSDASRIDIGPAYRFSAHMQLKLQYSYLTQDRTVIGRTNNIYAAQYTLRF